jgi:hypothetical protein
LNTGKKGAIAELIASAWLLKQGYEVFRNTSQNGIFDIIAIKNNEVKKIDVATVNPGNTVSRRKQDLMKKHGGCVAYFTKDGMKWDFEVEGYHPYQRDCKHCSNPFETYSKAGVYCGDICAGKVRLYNSKMTSRAIKLKAKEKQKLKNKQINIEKKKMISETLKKLSGR